MARKRGHNWKPCFHCPKPSLASIQVGRLNRRAESRIIFSFLFSLFFFFFFTLLLSFHEQTERAHISLRHQHKNLFPPFSPSLIFSTSLSTLTLTQAHDHYTLPNASRQRA